MKPMYIHAAKKGKKLQLNTGTVDILYTVLFIDKQCAQDLLRKG